MCEDNFNILKETFKHACILKLMDYVREDLVLWGENKVK
jgi:hypothetical protein